MAVKILSLDGGGSWSIIQVQILQAIYGKEAMGHDVLKEFDYVIATSGGSMVLAAMCENMSLEKITEIFLTQKILRSIFVKLSPFDHILHDALNLAGMGPRFSTKEKLIGLSKQLPIVSSTNMTDLPKLVGKESLQIIVTAFDYDRQREVFFRSNKNSLADVQAIEKELGLPPVSYFKETTLTRAVHASSTAPLNFFQEPAEFNLNSEPHSSRFWDGAVGGYNNPVFAGVMEAYANGVNVEDMQVLSIGSSCTMLPLSLGLSDEHKTTYSSLLKEKDDSTFLRDLLIMAESILSDPPDAATYGAYGFLREKLQQTPERIFRLNPVLQPVMKKGIWDLPDGLDIHQFSALLKMDMAVTDGDAENLIFTFCANYIKDQIPNQPIRNNANLECVIGHPRFSDGLGGWNNL